MAGCEKKNLQKSTEERESVFYYKGSNPEKIGVWCAVSQKWIVWPIFLEKNVDSDI